MAIGDDALSAALKMSFGVNGSKGQKAFGEREDLLQNVEDTFYGGGHAPPSPSPTPTPAPKAQKPTQMSLPELYDHFGVPNPVAQSKPTNTQPIYQNKPDQQIYNWRSNYGWSNA